MMTVNPNPSLIHPAFVKPVLDECESYVYNSKL